MTSNNLVKAALEQKRNSTNIVEFEKLKCILISFQQILVHGPIQAHLIIIHGLSTVFIVFF